MLSIIQFLSFHTHTTHFRYLEQKFEITDYMGSIKDLNLIKHRDSESKINND